MNDGPTLFGVPLTQFQQRILEVSFADNLSLLFLLLAQIGLTLSLVYPYKSRRGLTFAFSTLLGISFILGFMDVLRWTGAVDFWFYVDVRRYGFRLALAIAAWGNWFISYRQYKQEIYAQAPLLQSIAACPHYSSLCSQPHGNLGPAHGQPGLGGTPGLQTLPEARK